MRKQAQRGQATGPRPHTGLSVRAGVVLESEEAGGQSSIGTDLGLCPGSEVTGSGGEMGRAGLASMTLPGSWQVQPSKFAILEIITQVAQKRQQ